MLKISSVAFAALLASTAAHAATFSVVAFSETEWNNYVSSNAIVEHFEDHSTLSGQFENNALSIDGSTEGEILGSLQTSVGQFSSLGGTGTGSTCQNLDTMGNNCTGIALDKDPLRNGQGNIVPLDGKWALNSADTKGISWVAELASGGAFKSLVVAIKDAADHGRKKLTITVGDHSETFFTGDGTGLTFNNRNEKLLFIDFGGAVTTAQIDIHSSVNDGFTMDGAAINAVPLPASSMLLIGGMAALAGAARRRKTQKS